MEEIKSVNLTLDTTTWEVLKALPSQTREAFVLFAIKNSVNSEFYKTMTAKTQEEVVATAPSGNTTNTVSQSTTQAKTTVSWSDF